MVVVVTGVGADRRHHHRHPLDISTESYFTATVEASATSTLTHASSTWCHFTLVQPTKRGRFLNAKDRQYWYSALSLVVLRIHSIAAGSTAIGENKDGEERGANVATRIDHRGMEVTNPYIKHSFHLDRPPCSVHITPPSLDRTPILQRPLTHLPSRCYHLSYRALPYSTLCFVRSGGCFLFYGGSGPRMLPLGGGAATSGKVTTINTLLSYSKPSLSLP